MAKIRYYFDEGVNVAVASGLKRRGVEALTTRDANALGMSDIEQVEYAADNGLVIVTHDDDFLSLALNYEHLGIVFVHQNKYPVGEFIRRLKLLWDVLDVRDMENHIEFL